MNDIRQAKATAKKVMDEFSSDTLYQFYKAEQAVIRRRRKRIARRLFIELLWLIAVLLALWLYSIECDRKLADAYIGYNLRMCVVKVMEVRE